MDEESDFLGEHSETLGDVWAAVLGDSEKITPLLGEAITKGEKTDQVKLFANKEEMEVTMLQYPNNSLVKVGILLVKNKNDESWVFYSAFPILDGIRNPLTITATHTWINGVEGVVAAERTPDGPPVTFFDPFYFKEQKHLTLETDQNISLAALAFSIRQAVMNEFVVKEGAFYEEKLKEFLEKNPDKSSNDFSPPQISLRGSRILLPTQYVCEWEYRCKVTSCAQLKYFDTKFYRMEVIFVGEDDADIKGIIYASEHVLNGYKPKVGHDIEGILWMAGHISSAVTKNHRQQAMRIFIKEKNCHEELPALPENSDLTDYNTTTSDIISLFGGFNALFDYFIEYDFDFDDEGRKRSNKIFYSCETEDTFDYWKNGIEDFIKLLNRLRRILIKTSLEDEFYKIIERGAYILYGNDYECSIDGRDFVCLDDYIEWFNDKLDEMFGDDIN